MPSENLSSNFRGSKDVVIAVINWAAILSSASFRLAAPVPCGGSLSPAAERISLAQRKVPSISAGPAGKTAARCSLVCMTSRAMPISDEAAIASRSSA